MWISVGWKSALVRSSSDAQHQSWFRFRRHYHRDLQCDQPMRKNTCLSAGVQSSKVLTWDMTCLFSRKIHSHTTNLLQIQHVFFNIISKLTLASHKNTDAERLSKNIWQNNLLSPAWFNYFLVLFRLSQLLVKVWEKSWSDLIQKKFICVPSLTDQPEPNWTESLDVNLGLDTIKNISLNIIQPQRFGKTLN